MARTAEPDYRDAPCSMCGGVVILGTDDEALPVCLNYFCVTNAPSYVREPREVP